MAVSKTSGSTVGWVSQAESLRAEGGELLRGPQLEQALDMLNHVRATLGDARLVEDIRDFVDSSIEAERRETRIARARNQVAHALVQHVEGRSRAALQAAARAIEELPVELQDQAGVGVLFRLVAPRYAEVMLAGPRDRVRGVSWSPDGGRLLGLPPQGSGQATVWNAAGERVARLGGESWGRWVFEWCPDGRSFVACRRGEGPVLLHDHDGNLLQELSPRGIKLRPWSHTGFYSPDGSRIMMKDADGCLVLWDRDGAPVTAASEILGPVRRPTWSRTGVRVVAWTETGLAVWADGTVLRPEEDEFLHKKATFHWSPDSTMLLCVEPDRVRLFDRDLRLVGEALTQRTVGVSWSPLHGGPALLRGADRWDLLHRDGRLQPLDEGTGALQAAWHPGGERLVMVRSSSGDLDVVCLTLHGEVAARAELDMPGVQRAVPRWSPGGEQLLVHGSAEVAASGSLVLLNDQLEVLFRCEHGGVPAAPWAPAAASPRFLAVGASSGRLEIRDGGGGLLGRLAVTPELEAELWSPHGEHIVTRDPQLSTVLWRGDGSHRAELRTPTGPATEVGFDPRGELVAVCSPAGAAMHDPQGVLVRTLEELLPGSMSTQQPAWRGDGERLLTARWSADSSAEVRGAIQIWNRTGELVGQLDMAHERDRAWWGPRGDFLLFMTGDGAAARVYDAEGELVCEVRGQKIQAGVLMGDALAHGDATYRPELVLVQGGRLTRYDLGCTELGRAQRVHGPEALRVYRSPSGLMLLTVSRDGTAAVWDRELRNLWSTEVHDASVLRGAWSPDSTRWVTMSQNQAYLWTLDEGSGVRLGEGSNSFQDVVFAAGAEPWLMTAEYSRVRLWDDEGAELAEVWVDDVAQTLSWSASGDLVAVGQRGRSLQLLPGSVAEMLRWARRLVPDDVSVAASPAPTDEVG